MRCPADIQDTIIMIGFMGKSELHVLGNEIIIAYNIINFNYWLPLTNNLRLGLIR